MNEKSIDLIENHRSEPDKIDRSIIPDPDNENLMIRLKTDLKAYWRTIVIILAPIILCPLPASTSEPAGKCAYVVLLMVIYWMTEAVPLAVTALLPVILFPAFGIMSAKAVSLEYFKDTNFIFFGSMLMAVAVEECRLHRRIGLMVLVRIGCGPRRLMLGFMVSTCFLSMFMSNTSTTAIMVPFVLVVVQELVDKSSCANQNVAIPRDNLGYASSKSEQELNENAQISLEMTSCNVTNSQNVIDANAAVVNSRTSNTGFKQCSPQFQRTCKGLLLSICYAANIGGTGTLTGTGSNLVLIGQLESLYGSRNSGVTFASWMALATPQMVVILILAWIWLQIYFIGIKGCWKKQENNNNEDAGTKLILQQKLKEMGCVTFAEKMTIILFVILILLWLFRKPGFMPGWGDLLKKDYVSDGTAAMLVAFLLFIVPREKPTCAVFSQKRSVNRSKLPPAALINWEVMQTKFSWSILILLGGSFAMAAGVQASGLDTWISGMLVGMRTMPKFAFVTLGVVIVTFLTEFSSNVAVASIFIPIAASVAEETNMNPLYVMLPITIACSFAFCCPSATPPNAIVFGAGLLRVVDMAVAGFVMNIIAMFVLLVNINTYGVWLFDLKSMPAWALLDRANITRG